MLGIILTLVYRALKVVLKNFKINSKAVLAKGTVIVPF
jgi:hypothetical protein